jgi:hypothetical protein
MITAIYKREVFKAGTIVDIKSISDYHEFPGTRKIVISAGNFPLSEGFNVCQEPETWICGQIPSVSLALEPGASFSIVTAGTHVGSISLTTSVYKVISEIEDPGQIRRNALVTGSAETAYMIKHNISADVGTIIDIAKRTFRGKQYQVQLDLASDPEAEQWETLVFRFFAGMATPEILHYQKELARNFVARIEPRKRLHFSLIIEPV